MKNVFLILVFCISCLSIQAQTKLISHKSHSGSKATFRAALDGNLFDIGLSDFGEPRWFSATCELDSIVHVNDSISLVYKRGAKLGVSWGEMQDDKKWVPSVDTLINHPLFSQKHGLQNLRTQMRGYYEFRNWVDDIKFVGYDDELPEGEQPVPNEQKETPPTTPQSYTPINVEQPKECKKPKEQQQTKQQAIPQQQAPKNDNNTSYNIKDETPKPIFVSNHTTEKVKEASIVKESELDKENNIFLIVFGTVFLSVVLSMGLGFLIVKSHKG